MLSSTEQGDKSRGDKLPQELVSLIQHIRLNEAGWWEKGVHRLILSVVWLSDERKDEQSIESSLRNLFGVELQGGVEKHIETLLATGQVVRLQDGSLKISEERLTAFEDELQSSEELEDETKRVFHETVGKYLSDPQDNIWESFNEKLLIPFVKEMGARTYEIISGTSENVEEAISFSEFLQDYPEEQHASLRKAIVEFMNPKHRAVRGYVLRYLNAYFFVEAGNLNEQTIGTLTRITEQSQTFTLFLDTNVVFSLLGFHNNPSDDAVESLIKTVKKLSEAVELEFYLLPITLDETKRSIDASKASLKNIKLPANLAAAATQTDKLNGIAKKYAQATLKAGRPLKAEDFFGRYLNNLLPILRAGGVELFNDGEIDEYSTHQKVIDDLNDQKEFEESRYPEGKRKSYQQLIHDISLWHYTKDKRPVRVESPLEAQHWIVTIDYRLIRFDKYKISRVPGQIPVCIHPTSLIQLLQLWVPRTSKLEEAILNSFQLPLVSNEFDSDAERVTIDILETLARYEGIEGLPSKTVERIIVSDALRDKIKTETDTKKKSEFIHEAVIQENQKLAQMTENMRRAMSKQGEQIDTFLQVIEEQNQKIGSIGSELDEATDVNRNKENQLQEAKDQVEEAKEELSDFKRATAKWIASVVLLLMSSTALWLHDSWLGWEWLSGHSRQNTVLISLQLMLVFGLLNIPLPKYWKFWVSTLIAIFLAAIAL
jgi:hypothetical protein